ncbi:MAG: hypothetical protein JWN34_1770 [Bryobacterales bacterium]|nr:hypothetical protein [Bryobacterales bacterium]
MFRRYPFETWRTEGNVSQIRWKVLTPKAALSPHQRLIQRIEANLDAAEVERRRDHGELIYLFEIQTPGGQRLRNRMATDLGRIPPEVKARGISWGQELFLLPGVYKISLAIVDSKTKEHSFLSRELRVAPLRSDPLPAAWRDLPQAEFVRLYGQPDFWFQPGIKGRLSLPVVSKRKVQVEILMNMTLSERVQGSIRAFRRNMSVLIPGLRVLSGMNLENGSMDVTVLDLALRKKWEQRSVQGLNWEQMREPFAVTNPGIIDVQSLAGKAAMQQFFWDAVLDQLKPVPNASDEPPIRVVIVLSSPVFLQRQYKVEPASFPKDPNRRVYYLQYRPINPRSVMVRSDDGPAPAAVALPSDDLEHTLKLLDAKVFAIISPEQFRKALASILADIGRM